MESSNRAGSYDAPENAAGQVVEAAHFSAIRSVRTEAEALLTLARALDHELKAGFGAAVAAIHDIPGRVIVSGIGRSPRRSPRRARRPRSSIRARPATATSA